MVKEINKGLKLEILPNGSMVEVLEQNTGNARFIWNNLLGMYISNTCGYKNQNITLKTRQWTCPICKTKHHRDINAAKNILNESIKQNNLIKKRIKI
jgi:hypothetical protein